MIWSMTEWNSLYNTFNFIAKNTFSFFSVSLSDNPPDLSGCSFCCPGQSSRLFDRGPVHRTDTFNRKFWILPRVQGLWGSPYRLLSNSPPSPTQQIFRSMIKLLILLCYIYWDWLDPRAKLKAPKLTKTRTLKKSWLIKRVDENFRRSNFGARI